MEEVHTNKKHKHVNEKRTQIDQMERGPVPRPRPRLGGDTSCGAQRTQHKRRHIMRYAILKRKEERDEREAYQKPETQARRSRQALYTIIVHLHTAPSSSPSSPRDDAQNPGIPPIPMKFCPPMGIGLGLGFRITLCIACGFA